MTFFASASGVRRAFRDRRHGGAAYLLLALLLACVATATAAEDEWQGVERIVAVGDIHGDYDNYIQVLADAGVVNRRGKWVGGKTHFVQVGDVPDRGPDTDRIIEHLMKLEKQAERAGGKVHALIGNHEAMNISGDLRYVHPGEYDALKSRDAKRLRENYYQRVVDFLSQREDAPVIDEAFREKWLAEHPLGFVEHRQYWHPEGEFGAWVTEHNTIIKINNMLFLHGGLSPVTLQMTLREINDRVRRELRGPVTEGMLYDSEDSPLWYRGLSRPETDAEALHVDALLEHFDADYIVLGHTPGYGTIVPRYDSRVLVIDAGIAEHYGSHRASLLVEKGELFTVQRGEAIPIPANSDGLLAYFRRVAEIETDVPNLRAVIQRLERADAEPEPAIDIEPEPEEMTP
jgi:hypothetical protein